MQLTATDRRWSQYAYQFAHEFCHVMIDPYHGERGSNQWFEEALCEMASVFVLRRMSERWRATPPYPNWSSYSSSIADYVNARLTNPDHALPSGESMTEWFAANEDTLRQDPYQRNKNAVVAYSLLSIFEEHPSAWNAVQHLPVGQYPIHDITTLDHLRSWRSSVDSGDRQIVDQVMQLFGMD